MSQNLPPRTSLKPTSFDYAMAALSPVLIITMIGSLVFFLMIALYQGDFLARLLWILGLFTLATVLITRIAIEQSRAQSMVYLALLSGATLLVAPRFFVLDGKLAPLSLPILIAFLGLIIYLADRITMDCTAVDHARESNGEGLLQSLGILKPARTKRAVNDPAADDSKKRKRHNPGVWVLYFSLIALPVFGVGQWMIASPNARRLALVCMIAFLFSAMALLVVISLLSVRQYAREREIEMQPAMAIQWLISGGVAVLILVTGMALLPLPMLSSSGLTAPFRITSRTDLTSSQHGWGNEGAGNKPAPGQQAPSQQKAPGQPSNGGKPAEAKPAANAAPSSASPSNKPNAASPSPSASGAGGTNDKSNDPSGDQGNPGPGTSPSKTPSANNSSGASKGSGERSEPSSSKSSEGTSPSSSSSQGQSKGGAKSDQPSADSQSNQQPSDSQEPNQQPSKNGDRSDANARPSNPDAAQSKEGGAQPQRDATKPAPGKGPQQEPGQAPLKKEPTPPPTPSYSLEWNLGAALQWLLVAILLAVTVICGIWYRREILQSLRQWLAPWLAWFRGDDQPDLAPDESNPAIAVPAVQDFASLSNPFATASDPNKTVQSLFQAAMVWGREHRVPRREDETPDEYLRRLGNKYQVVAEPLAKLGWSYSRIAYAQKQASREEAASLRPLWDWFVAHPARGAAA
ncbi:MAG: DUF4129 domain-containing protein [Pirellula sp.]